MATKKSAPLGHSVRTMRIVLGFLGVGVAVAALFAIVLTVKSNLDVRSKASGFSHDVKTRCYPWGKTPYGCKSGYKCVLDEKSNASLRQGQWGVCVVKPTPIPTPTPVVKCNPSINPPVLCPKGFDCQYGRPEISIQKPGEYTPQTAPSKGAWGICVPEVVYGGCNLSINPPRLCQTGYYCKSMTKCDSEKCIGGDGVCVKLGVTTTPTPTPKPGCYYITKSVQCTAVQGGPPCPSPTTILVCQTPSPATPSPTVAPGCYYESTNCVQVVGGPPCPTRMLICQSKTPTPKIPVYVP